MPAEKQPTSFRLSADALKKLALIAKQSGISQASTLELAIREMAKQKGVR
jgi:hypothetical protein